jgi:hypothetical protein
MVGSMNYKALEKKWYVIGSYHSGEDSGYGLLG